MFQAAALCITLCSLAALLGGETAELVETPVEISDAEKNNDGFLVHRVRSPYQSGPTLVKILLPDGVDDGKHYRVLYVLPVEAGDGDRWGRGLLEVKKHDLHNRHRLICVLPTFSQLPWYADHPTNPGIRQESHFLRVVVPLVESRYPALVRPEGRLLVGFSKSGWGAFTLLLRNPQLFAGAAAWDAPLMEPRPERFGMGPIFGTQENFEHYQVSTLLERQAPSLRQNTRLVLTGSDAFRPHHVETHEQLTNLAVPHVYRDGPHRRHHWQSGWLPEAVNLLVSPDPPP